MKECVVYLASFKRKGERKDGALIYQGQKHHPRSLSSPREKQKLMKGKA